MESPQIEMGGFKVNSPQMPNGGLRPSMIASWNSRRTVERALKSIRIVIFTSKLNLLMPFGPASIILHFTSRRHGLIFLFSMLGITPLAERLGYATEQLAIYTGPTVGGLLNATFGNATEMIIAVYALKNGMVRVVQQSLLGSILSNMLLVMGCAFFAGGIVHRNKDQVFSKATAVVNSGLLLMAVMGIMFPAVLHFTHSEVRQGASEVALSRFSSCIMLVAYASYLYFQLSGRSNIYSPIGSEEMPNEDATEEDEEAEIGMWEAVTWLAVLTLWVSVLSEYLVNAIEGASDSLNLPVAFISVILLPIVGNAAEHASAIMFAMKDKLDITLGVAIGSSTQISMFVIPFCVVTATMLLRRLLHSSRHLRHGLQNLTPAITAPSSSSPLTFRRVPDPITSRFLSPRLLSTSGHDDDGSKPWTFAPDSGDPDPFAHVDAAADAGEAPALGSAGGAEEPWAKGFRAEDGENGDVFDEIYKEAASTPPARGEAAPAGDDEQWTLSGEEEKDPFAAAVLGEGIEGIETEVGALDELDAGEDHEAELKQQQNRAREKELMETLKGPNRAFGDLIAASGITEEMIDSLILLKDTRGIPGLPPLTEIEDRAIQELNATSSRAEVERQKQEEIAKARVRQVDEKGRAYGTGKRKCSIARVWIQLGDGKFIVNDKEFDAYFPILDHRADLLRPFTVTKNLGRFDVTCTVKGGGVSGQVGAIRLGTSRALQNFEPGLRPELKKAGYLTRDSRVVERKKPGKAKARKSFQWVKR